MLTALRALLGGGRKRRGRRATSREQRRAQQTRERATREARRQRELDREAAAWIRRDNERRARAARERAREERAKHSQRLHEARQIATLERRYQRARSDLQKQGFSSDEINELLEDFGLRNPKLRLPMALDFLRGGHTHARRNPRCRVCQMNPTSAEASAMFHGRPDLTSNGRVVVGDIEEIVYRAPSGSKRAGVPWRHIAGDTGGLLRNRGRARLLADPNTGAMTLETRGSGVRWNARRGIVG